MPLSIVAAGANRHDVTQLERLLDLIEVERPDIFARPQHPCLDMGYAREPALGIIAVRRFVPPCQGQGEGRQPGA